MSHARPSKPKRVMNRWRTLPPWQKVLTGIAPLACGGMIAVGLTLPSGGGTTSEKTNSPSPSTHTYPTYGGVFVAKIDNVGPARPSTGVGKAKIVYVEQVEGGLSRIMAVFGRDDLPSKLGPVRSAREADLELLRQYGKVQFAYSGATSPLLPYIAKANVCNYSAAKQGGAYYRSGPHWAPHNLYINPTKLPECGEATLSVHSGKAPAGGTSDSSVSVSYPAASYRFDWTGSGYTVYMDGNKATDYATGTETAHTVIVQHVTMDKAVHGSHKTPFTRTVGSGKAEIYRDGKRFDGKWDRPDADKKTEYTYNGKDVSFDTGQVWILLAH